MSKTELLGKIDKGEFIISVQLDPPSLTKDGSSYIEPIEARARASEFIKTVDRLQRLGVSVVDINSSRNPRLDSSITAAQLTRSGLCILPHHTLRDNTTIGLERKVVGLSILGITDHLVITGDPYRSQSEGSYKGVYQHGLIETLKILKMNLGDAGVALGAAINQNGNDLEEERQKIEHKKAVGTDFFMSQPVFDLEQSAGLTEFLGGSSFGRPVLVGIWPLIDPVTIKNIGNGRISGVSMPETIFAQAGSFFDNPVNLKKWGLDYSGKLIERLRSEHKFQGVYIIAPSREPGRLTELLTRVLS